MPASTRRSDHPILLGVATVTSIVVAAVLFWRSSPSRSTEERRRGVGDNGATAGSSALGNSASTAQGNNSPAAAGSLAPLPSPRASAEDGALSVTGSGGPGGAGAGGASREDSADGGGGGGGGGGGTRSNGTSKAEARGNGASASSVAGAPFGGLSWPFGPQPVAAAASWHPNVGNAPGAWSPAGPGGVRRQQAAMSASEKRDLDMMFRHQERQEGRVPSSTEPLQARLRKRQRKADAEAARSRRGGQEAATEAADECCEEDLRELMIEELVCEEEAAVRNPPSTAPSKATKKTKRRTRKKPKAAASEMDDPGPAAEQLAEGGNASTAAADTDPALAEHGVAHGKVDSDSAAEVPEGATVEEQEAALQAGAAEPQVEADDGTTAPDAAEEDEEAECGAEEEEEKEADVEAQGDAVSPSADCANSYEATAEGEGLLRAVELGFKGQGCEAATQTAGAPAVTPSTQGPSSDGAPSDRQGSEAECDGDEGPVLTEAAVSRPKSPVRGDRAPGVWYGARNGGGGTADDGSPVVDGILLARSGCRSRHTAWADLADSSDEDLGCRPEGPLVHGFWHPMEDLQRRATSSSSGAGCGAAADSASAAEGKIFSNAAPSTAPADATGAEPAEQGTRRIGGPLSSPRDRRRWNEAPTPPQRFGLFARRAPRAKHREGATAPSGGVSASAGGGRGAGSCAPGTAAEGPSSPSQGQSTVGEPAAQSPRGKVGGVSGQQPQAPPHQFQQPPQQLPQPPQQPPQQQPQQRIIPGLPLFSPPARRRQPGAAGTSRATGKSSRTEAPAAAPSPSSGSAATVASGVREKEREQDGGKCELPANDGWVTVASRPRRRGQAPSATSSAAA